jgi:hypothetical protein
MIKVEEMTLEQFKKYIHKNNDNQIKSDLGICEMFEDIQNNKTGFALVCKKCGSMKIEIDGEDGKDYGGQTGYSSGENIIKCLNCGNAVTLWK